MNYIVKTTQVGIIFTKTKTKTKICFNFFQNKSKKSFGKQKAGLTSN